MAAAIGALSADSHTTPAQPGADEGEDEVCPQTVAEEAGIVTMTEVVAVAEVEAVTEEATTTSSKMTGKGRTAPVPLEETSACPSAGIFSTVNVPGVQSAGTNTSKRSAAISSRVCALEVQNAVILMT